MRFRKAHGLILAFAGSLVLGVAPAAKAKGCNGHFGCANTTTPQVIVYNCPTCGGYMNIVVPGPYPNGGQLYEWESYCSAGCCGTEAESELYDGSLCMYARRESKGTGEELARLWTTHVFYTRGCDGTYSIIMLKVPVSTV